MTGESLLLGIDGGGTKTVAWLARFAPLGPLEIVGRGSAGPANPQAIGFPAAFANLDRAVQAAFEDRGSPPRTVAAAVLALAGSDRQAPAMHIALAGAMATWSALMAEATVFFEQGPQDEAARRWARDRRLFDIPFKVRAMRTERAWERVARAPGPR